MSRKKAFEVKASLIQKASNYKGVLTSVVAAKSPDKYKVGSVETSKVICKACHTPFATNKSLAAVNCVVCSSDDIEEVEDTEVEEPVEEFTDEDELAAIKCNHCQVSNILTLETAKLFDGKINCVVCGTESEYDVPEDDEENLDEESFDEDESVEAEDEELDEVDNQELDTSDDAVDFEDTEELEESAGLNDNDHTGDEDGENDKLKVNDGNSAGKKVTLPEKPTPNKAENDNPVEADLDDDEQTVNSDPGAGGGQLEIFDDSEIDLHETVAGVFEVDRIGDKIYAFKNNIPVAVLSKENAGENKAVFNSKSLVASIENSLKNNRDVEDVLASYKFEVAKAKFPYSKLVNEKVEAKLSEKKAEVAATQQDYQGNLKQCMEIAAAGLNKNFFQGEKRNVLKAALIEKFETAGVRDAKKIVSNVFANHSDEYNKLLLEVASELMKKSVSTRNELANAMNETKLVVAENEEDLEDEEYDEEMDISESRLEKATLSTSKSKSKQTASPFVAQSSVSSVVANLRQNNGGRIF